MDNTDDSNINWDNVLVWSIYIFIVVLLISGVLIIFATIFYCISLDYQLRRTRRQIFLNERNQRLRDHKYVGQTLLKRDNKVAEVVAYIQATDTSEVQILPDESPKELEEQRSIDIT